MEKSHKTPKIYVALPVLNEFENIPCFISDLRKQSGNTDFELYVCVNQPNEWWEIEVKINICLNNLQTISYLQKIRNESGFPINIIDRSSKGNGWQSKNLGVGWARKTIMDEINIHAKDNDLILSIDADTGFNAGYFLSVIDSFQKFPKATALAVPYYHRLTDDDIANRAILHYEIYMRYYNINLLRIKSPYSFTALGSAIVLPVWAYRNIGGMTPKKSGEDFYFLQKLRKYGNMI